VVHEFLFMRTTLDIDDDVLQAAKEQARRENKSLGQVISELARAALTTTALASPKGSESRSHYGIRPFHTRGGVVTNELIDRLREGDAY
jgi:hypothetical protein